MAQVAALGGRGGVIVATPAGEGVFSFTTPGMYRGTASPAGRSVALYGDESSMIRRLFLVLLLALAPTPAFAWWEYGHETVATIA